MGFLMGRGGGVVLDVCAVFGGVEGVDCGGGLGELEEGNLEEDGGAAEGGDDGVVVCVVVNALYLTTKVAVVEGRGTLVSSLYVRL